MRKPKTENEGTQKPFAALIESLTQAAHEWRLIVDDAKAAVAKLHKLANPDFVGPSIANVSGTIAEVPGNPVNVPKLLAPQTMSPPPANEPRWASLKAAARYSGLSEQTLRNYAAKGMITLRRIRVEGATRGATRLDLRALDRLIEDASAIPATIAMNARRPVRPRPETGAPPRKGRRTYNFPPVPEHPSPNSEPGL